MRGIVGNTPLRSFIDKGQVGVDWGGLIKRSEVCYVRKYLVHWRGGGKDTNEGVESCRGRGNRGIR